MRETISYETEVGIEVKIEIGSFSRSQKKYDWGETLFFGKEQQGIKVYTDQDDYGLKGDKMRLFEEIWDNEAGFENFEFTSNSVLSIIERIVENSPEPDELVKEMSHAFR